MNEQQRSMGHSSIFAMFGDAMIKGVPTAATWGHLKYTEQRVSFRFCSWWYDEGLYVVRAFRAEQDGGDANDDTNDYVEMRNAARKYALNVLAGHLSRKLLRRFQVLLEQSGQEVDKRISDFESETEALYTLLRDGGIDPDAMIQKLS